MFLFTLVIFPVISYFLFNMYKNDFESSNWFVKLIWIIWLWIISLSFFTEIFHRTESYLVLIMLWYLIVFFYYYIQNVKLQLKNIDKIKYKKIDGTNVIITLFFMFLIFFFYILLIEDRDFTYLANFILFWLLYEIIDVIKNNIFRKMIDSKITRSELKSELKREILKEIK